MAEQGLAPVQPAERINEIDIVRGLALFGILMVNMSFFKAPVYLERLPSNYPAGIEQISAWFIQLFFEGKFYAIFSFLFGLGFYIFMERVMEKGLELVPLYRRRLFALLIFGLAHLVFFWSGDILLIYALGGFILLGFRNKSFQSIRKWIIGLFFVTLVLNSLIYIAKGVGEVLAGPEYEAMMSEMLAGAMAAYTEGSFFELVAFRMANEVPYVIISIIAWIPAVLAFFLCGLYTGKLGIFKNLQQNITLLKRVRKWGFFVGALILLLFIFAETGIWPLDPLLRLPLLPALNYAASLFIFPAYIAAWLLAVQGGFFKRLLGPVAAAGRMALTNYLSQTLICVLLFYGFGLGLYGRVSLAEGILITLGIYFVQIIWSNLWLKKFKYGPMEWFWRLLTYKKIQTLLIHKQEVS